MTAICRSYFDPLLLAAVLRWCKPDEVWWGADSVGAVVQETVARFDHDDAGRRILLGELVLAGIMGKVPRDGLDPLAQMALLEAEPLPPGDVKAALTWGAAVIQHAIASP